MIATPFVEAVSLFARTMIDCDSEGVSTRVNSTTVIQLEVRGGVEWGSMLYRMRSGTLQMVPG